LFTGFGGTQESWLPMAFTLRNQKLKLSQFRHFKIMEERNQNFISTQHPHGPEDPRWITEDGRCLLCADSYHKERIAELESTIEQRMLESKLIESILDNENGWQEIVNGMQPCPTMQSAITLRFDLEATMEQRDENKKLAEERLQKLEAEIESVTKWMGQAESLSREARVAKAELEEFKSLAKRARELHQIDFEGDLASCDRWIKWCDEQKDGYGQNFYQGMRSALVFQNIIFGKLINIILKETNVEAFANQTKK
jgi:hypothetical protein